MNEVHGGPRGSTLRGRLLVAFLLLSLIPLFGSNAVGFLRSRVIVEGLVARYLEGLADVQAAHVQDRLDQRSLVLEAVASGNRFLEAAAERGTETENPGMSAAASPEVVRGYLRRQLEEVGQFDALALLDRRGTLLTGTDPDADPTEWAAAQGAGVSLIRTRGADVPPVLRLTVPVTDAEGETVALLAGTIPLDQGTDLLEIPEHVAGTIESFILDEEGRPIFVSHEHGHLRYNERLASPLARLPPGRTARYVDREGIDVIGSSAALPGYGWTFLAEAPVSDALGELRALRTLSLVLGMLFAVLVVGAAAFLAGRIVAPIHHLVGATRRLGAGDLDARVIEEGDAEVAELGRAFNEMAAELASNHERIDRMHRREIERAGQLATVGELASGLAHEIKNPVVGISNGLDLVLKRVDDPELDPIASEMRRQIGRIESTVRDLLAFARPQEPTLAPVDLEEVVRRAVTLIEPGAQKGRVGIRIEVEQGIPRIQADGELLRQGIVNLLVNAVSFSPEGDEVVVSLARDGGWVRLSVEDHGPGMDEDTRQQIFRPFFTTRASGTGLGLPITRGIVEQHGGTLEVTTAPGRGTTFVMVLPEAGS